jgi:pimeloyl-ACP methyl ester carboxylesterase
VTDQTTTTATATAAARTRRVDLPGGLSVTVTESGAAEHGGRGVLVLHGGAGPRSVAGLSAALSEHVHVVTPTHPGFDGTPRPEDFDSVADLAVGYLDLIDALGLREVMVIGNSIGGWIAAEMALRDNHGRIAALVLLNAVGIHACRPENRIVNPSTVPPAEVGRLAFALERFRPDPASFTEEQRTAAAANQRTLAVYGGEHFSHDPKLRGRLHRLTLPVLVLWGEQDRIAPLDYGRGYARAFPNGRLRTVPDAGHFPHIEQPTATLEAIGAFADEVGKPGDAD